jgi:hypothetical protein
MAFGIVTANASAHESVYDAAMPGVTYGLLIATHCWLWHVLWHYTTFHNLCFLSLALLVGNILLGQMSGQPLSLSSSSSWPSHVRNHPFLPWSGRHAYFIIERWLS